jgi:ferrous iron transport protein A
VELPKPKELKSIMLMKTQNITQAFPLAMAGEGEWVKIDRVVGGKKLFKRLIAMGLIEETELQVIQRQRGSGIVVARGGTRLALGIGMANKIMVVPIEENCNDVT